MDRDLFLLNIGELFGDSNLTRICDEHIYVNTNGKVLGEVQWFTYQLIDILLTLSKVVSSNATITKDMKTSGQGIERRRLKSSNKHFYILMDDKGAKQLDENGNYIIIDTNYNHLGKIELRDMVLEEIQSIGEGTEKIAKDKLDITKVREYKLNKWQDEIMHPNL